MSTNKFLIVALIIASFFLGSLTNKVATLERNGTSSSNVRGAALVPTDAPQQPPTQQAKAKAVTDSDHIRGNKNAKITLVEYSDFECPFCQRFHPVTQELLKIYGDKIRLVYRHFPLSFHANAQKEAEASECIAELGGNDKFWSFVDAIFERTTANGTGFALDKLGPLASELGVNQVQFQSCLDSGKYEQLVKDQLAEGTAAGVNGTPSIFIINSKGESKLIVGAQPIDAFKTAIDSALK
ncbi:MAG: DsbA family protein [Candidatus Levybacteria bacterium]|nr:DsbA family protein [Candidatus Levybacteria bacterium]